MQEQSRSSSCFGARNESKLQPEYSFDIEVRCHLHRCVCCVRYPSTRGTPVSSLRLIRYTRCLLMKVMTMNISISISITFIFFLVLLQKSDLGFCCQRYSQKKVLLVLVPMKAQINEFVRRITSVEVKLFVGLFYPMLQQSWQPFLPRIRKIPDSNFGQKTIPTDCGFSWFLSIPSGRCSNV